MMDESTAIARVRDHLAELTRSVNGRPVGSSANHALTSADIQKLIDSVIHTPDDTLDIVSPRRIATVACQMAALLKEIGPPVITTP